MIRPGKPLGAAAIVAAALIPTVLASAAVGGGPAAALGVSPLRLELKGGSSASISVRNPAARSVVVTVTEAGFARSLHGKPRIKAPQGAAGWLKARPRRLRLAPHQSASFRLTAKPPAHSHAGDHPALVLLTTRPPASKKVHVVLRVGVVVLVRVAGTVVHDLVPRALSVRRDGATRLFALRLANRGNVAEQLRGSRLELELRRAGKTFATLRARRLELLPHSAGIAQFGYRGRARGSVVARVIFHPATVGRTRTFAETVP